MTGLEISRELSAPTPEDRLGALSLLLKKTVLPPQRGRTVGHIHTSYSFSPYSPASAAFFARLSGCSGAGIIDHDTAAGTREFFEAGRILGIETGSGVECRVSMAGTPFESVYTNNPCQAGISYFTLQGLSLDSADRLTEYFTPYRSLRLSRGRAMTERIASLLPEAVISFDDDVIPLSMCSFGGTVTERHILYALAVRLVSVFGRGKKLEERLSELCAVLTEKQKEHILDTGNPYYEYDVMHILKGGFAGEIYIPAGNECMALAELTALARREGAICCYAYLGDISDSVTEDKAPRAFEDSYLKKLLSFLKEAGVDAVTHSQTRNTAKQTAGLLSLCRSLKLAAIEGGDINSPRQEFI